MSSHRRHHTHTRTPPLLPPFFPHSHTFSLLTAHLMYTPPFFNIRLPTSLLAPKRVTQGPTLNVPCSIDGGEAERLAPVQTVCVIQRQLQRTLVEFLDRDGGVAAAGGERDTVAGTRRWRSEVCAARRALYADQAGIAARLVAVLHEFPPAMDAHANRRVTRMVDAEIRRGLAKHPPHHLRADTFGRGRRMRGVVAVDGTIGAGKSTAIAAVACKGRSRVVSFPEPIGEWAGLLSLVYAGKAGAALAFQGLVLLYFHNLGHLIRSRRRPDGCVHLVERTMQSADVFVKNMQNTPGFSAKDGRIYAEWCRRADRWVPFSACYLSLQSGVALQRTVERGRTCEGGLSSAFLGQLTHLYDSHYTQLAAEQAEWESRSPQDRQWLPPVMGVVRISAGASSRDEIANQVWTVCETSSYATPPAELPPVDAEEKHQANEANRVMRLQDKVNEADEVFSAGNYDVALPHYNEAIEMAEGPSEKGTLYTKYEDPDFSEAAGEPVTHKKQKTSNKQLWTTSSAWSLEEEFLFNQALGRTTWSEEEAKLMASMQANGNSFEEWDAAVRGEEQREQRAVGESKSPFAAVFAFSRLTGNREGGSEEATATEMVKSPPEKLPVEDKNMAQLLPLPCAPVEVDDEAYLDPPATGTEEIEAQNAVGGCDSAHAGCDCEELTGCGGCGESFSGSEWVAMQTIPGVCNEHPGWCGNCVDQACSQEEGCSPRGCGGPTACSCGFNAENADETLPPCFGCGSVCHLHCQGMFVPGFGSGGGGRGRGRGGGCCV